MLEHNKFDDNNYGYDFGDDNDGEVVSYQDFEMVLVQKRSILDTP